MTPPGDSQVRDQLALVRTHLANERTLLAFIRTALALGGAGAVLLHFFPDSTALATTAWLMLGAGVLTLVLGALRFVAVRRQLALESTGS